MEMLSLLENACETNEENDIIGYAEKIWNPHLKKAVIYIENNYHNTIDLKDIMRAVALSHSSLTQLFKKELGMTPIKYVWHYRILIAERMLASTNLPMQNIAKRCGFQTAQHFSRKFEESHGCTPTAFRNAAASNKAEGREAF
jgi:AraC family transcriptional regulator of arabinose operon